MAHHSASGDLFMAIYARDEARVRALLAKGATANGKRGYGDTTLHAACRDGHMLIVARLLAAGATVDQPNETDGSTPLQVAVQRGHSVVVAHLLGAGAAVNRADARSSLAPLHVASQRGDAKVVALLLAGRATVDVGDAAGTTPLHYACARGHTSVGAQLLAAGAPASPVNCKGDTPLHCACEHGHTRVVAHLLAAGADMATRNARGRTPAHRAFEAGHLDVINQLRRARLGDAAESPWHDVHAAARAPANTLARFYEDELRSPTAGNVRSARSHRRTPGATSALRRAPAGASNRRDYTPRSRGKGNSDALAKRLSLDSESDPSTPCLY